MKKLLTYILVTLIIFYVNRWNSNTSCQCIKTYIPSSIESRWLSRANEWDSDVCLHLLKSKLDIQMWISYATGKATVPVESSVDIYRPHELLSKYIITHCSIHHEVEYIEPLVGVPRDPRICYSPRYTFSADHIFLSTGCHRDFKSKNAYYFDAGATTFKDKQHWFISEFHKHGIIFDRLWLWEVNNINFTDVFAQVPNQLLPRYTYYNHPVTCDKTSFMDPLNIISAMTTEDDFVVFKLDIDFSALEECLIQRILSERKLSRLIDVLFFEHHVNVSMMHRYWGRKQKLSLHDSLATFGKLRSLGIRVHGWM